MRVGDFSFDALLYDGASTAVYAGVRMSDGAAVVGKLVRDGRRSLAAEARMLDKVARPDATGAAGARSGRIIESLGVFDSASGPVLVMRRFGTCSLADALRDGRFSTVRALDIARQLAEACGWVHGQRVVHRDIKPANIMYDPASGAIALGDFSSAIELPVNARALPPGELVGTPAYASPEHTGRTRDGCDTRSDLYSLGVTLYELLTGTRPFADGELLDVVAAHLSRAPEPPSRRVPAIPPVVSELVVKLLAKAPDERYQSARGLAADLERCLTTVAPSGEIASFALGRSDLVRLRPMPRLYGRDDELAVMREAFARAAAGQPALVLVSGHEGAGRSSLVHAMVREVAADGHAALGEWAAASERPLSALSDALGALAEALLRLDEDQLGRLRRDFAARVGGAGQVVVDVVPALADVLGAQPPLAELPPEAARARLHHGVRCLVSALGEEAPFVLGLRGFEHADAATVSVIESILTSPIAARVVVVLIAREPSAFGALREHPGARSLELKPLSAAAIGACTAAALDSEPERTAELADVLHARTGGNLLMFVRLLEHLVETSVIERRDGAFSWSLEAVRAAPPPATLGALAAQRIAALDRDTGRMLAAVASCDEPTDAAALAAMLAVDEGAAVAALAALEREGFVVASGGGYRVTHAVIGETALAAAGLDEVARVRGRLGAYLLARAPAAPTGDAALRVALALHRGAVELAAPDQLRAAELYAIAGAHVMATTAYELAATLFAGAAARIDGAADAWQLHRALRFRIELAHARCLIMLRRHGEADVLLEGLARRELSPTEIGLVYWTWCDGQMAAMNRQRVLALGLEGLARLGLRLDLDPPPLRPFAAMRLNQRLLRKLTTEDHIARPPASDERASAIVRLLSTMSPAAQYERKSGLFIMICEVMVWLTLRHGHFDFTVAGMTMHACFSHAMKSDYREARRIYEACVAISEARPAPHLAARTTLALHYMVGAWFGTWHDSTQRLARGIQLGAESGETVFAALCASASIVMLSLCGTPLDRLVAAIEGWGPLLNGDGGVAANAANVVNIAGKMSRGEPVTQGDLDRVTSVPFAAGSMRHNAMVNLALALVVIGHEAQVRAWHEEIGPIFPQINMAAPHAMTLWMFQGLYAIKDLRAGRAARRVDALRILDKFRLLRRETGATNNDPMIALLEAELARADGELDRAAGLFGRAVREARERSLFPIFAYANEEWAIMLDEAGYPADALLYYREALAGYRRWAHLTKVHELERTHPELRAIETSAVASTITTTQSRETAGINQQLDLVTVLKVSQDITTQLTDSGVVRAVLAGIAQNAGAERVVFVKRAATGADMVYGEVCAGAYRDLGVALDGYAGLPRSVVRVVRRTGRPLIVADATGDPGHAADPFVIETRARSLAGIPVRHKGEVIGFVVLENRLVAGAFTPQLVSLTQALVGQAAISLDNASLYRDLEDRVAERTAQLHARNTELRLVLDHVAQGLVIAARDGRLLAERSAILATWFPEGLPATVAGLFADDAGAAAWFDIAWEQLVDGFLPLDMALHQMPRQLRRADRVLAFDWQPIIGGDGALERVLLVVSDVTAALRQAEIEREQSQVMAMLERLADDRGGALEFLREAAGAVSELAAGGVTAEVEQRLLHTVKGNAAVFGLSALAARCHELESAMEVDARRLTGEERAGFAAAWQALHRRLSRFIDVSDGFLQVRRTEVAAALAALRRDGHPVAHDLELWSLEPMRVRFERIAEQARALAERLGKAPIDVAIDHGGIHLDAETWAPFWSAFVHVVRNAIDHGLEEPAERARCGKGAGALTLRSYFRGQTLVFELSDDGRGIAWDKLRDRALAARLPVLSHADLVAALFHDGISTRSEASETSGRGVGLGALAQVCRAMGVEIVVDSRPGHGTTMRFELPALPDRAATRGRGFAAISNQTTDSSTTHQTGRSRTVR